MKKQLHIVKIGGSLMEEPGSQQQLVQAFTQLDGPKILVHGGGGKASQLESALGLEPKMVHGRRITSPESLEVVVMVYAGLLNKTLVAALQAQKCNALGVCGADANLIAARKRPVRELDYGLVGDVTAVNTEALSTLLEAGYSPVLCAITHDGKGQLLNTNADTIATEIAIQMGQSHEVILHYCFDRPGVLKNPGDATSIIPRLDHASYHQLKAQGVIHGGMLPKLDNCFRALQSGVSQIRLGSIAMLIQPDEPYTLLST